MTEDVEGATWIRMDTWPHVEFPRDSSGDAIRWPKKFDQHMAGWPKWRCARCKEYIKTENSRGDWSIQTPCENEMCKAYFVLRWPLGVEGPGTMRRSPLGPGP